MSEEDAWAVLLAAEITFSMHCRSGLQARCECWRCRKSRGEEATDETERLAAEQSRAADAEYEAKRKERGL